MASDRDMPTGEVDAGFWRKRVVEPILNLLRTGATPERLAWSMAAGFVIGVNPLLGSTTVLSLAAAPLLGLNLVASQLANHLSYPLELALFPVFIRAGRFLFRTEALPMDFDELFRAARLHPWDTTRLLWRWEWHALVAWAIFAAVVAPLLAMALKPPLAAMLVRLHNQPIVEK
jgi:uncharacterized protein (DUF2062 family)